MSSLDHLVGKLLELRWHINAEFRGGLEVDHQIEPLRALYRQLAWLGTVQDFPDVISTSSEYLGYVRPIRNETAGFWKHIEQGNKGEKPNIYRTEMIFSQPNAQQAPPQPAAGNDSAHSMTARRFPPPWNGEETNAQTAVVATFRLAGNPIGPLHAMLANVGNPRRRGAIANHGKA
jgi:hypothetical protein